MMIFRLIVCSMIGFVTEGYVCMETAARMEKDSIAPIFISIAAALAVEVAAWMLMERW